MARYSEQTEQDEERVIVKHASQQNHTDMGLTNTFQEKLFRKIFYRQERKFPRKVPASRFLMGTSCSNSIMQGLLAKYNKKNLLEPQIYELTV